MPKLTDHSRTSQTDWKVEWFLFFFVLRNSFTAVWLKTSFTNIAWPNIPKGKTQLYGDRSACAELWGLLQAHLAPLSMSAYCLYHLQLSLGLIKDPFHWLETMHSALSNSVRKELVRANCNTRLRIEFTFVNDLLFLQTTNRMRERERESEKEKRGLN